jgi:hypothetical protein
VIQLRLFYFQYEYCRSVTPLFSLHPMGDWDHAIPICPINGVINFVYLIKMVSARFHTNKFLFAINNYFIWRQL